MRFLAALLVAAFILPCWAGQKITAVTVDGTTYLDIQDAHIIGGGRVVLTYPAGGATVPASKLTKAFLDSWGISQAEITEASAEALRRKKQEVDDAVRNGMFREVEGVVYDLRKPQANWVKLNSVKLLSVTPEGALAELASTTATSPLFVVIHNLPSIYADGDKVSVFVKATGPMVITSRSGERTVRSYDAGRACPRSEVPAQILQDGIAFAPSMFPPKEAHRRSFSALPDHKHIHAIGSGFFVTRDGYLLTNHHVVKDAVKIEVTETVQHKTYPAKVVAEDLTNDLALLKVEGNVTFEPLAISRKESADLGQEVFTIGFPNIQIQGVEPKYTDGKISSLAGMQDDASEYQISVPVQPGNSGGPLCDTQGQVVGIVVARMNDMAMLETSGVVPQNVNYAVKSLHALRLVQSVKGLNLLPPPVVRTDNAVKTVENAIVMVAIY